jgi:hypothetical protein
MDVPAKKGDPMQKTKDDCVANLKKLYPHIQDSDMNSIVSSIFKLLKVTDNVEAQHTKKSPPKKRTEQQKENKREKRRKSNAIKRAERLQREENERQGKPAGESPQKAAQQKQKTPAGYTETDEDGAYGEDAY